MLFYLSPPPLVQLIVRAGLSMRINLPQRANSGNRVSPRVESWIGLGLVNIPPLEAGGGAFGEGVKTLSRGPVGQE